MNWYQKTSSEIFDELDVLPEKGLSSEEAKKRLGEYGLNVLAQEHKLTYTSLFIKQFKSPLIYILLIASLLVFFLGDILDGVVIIAVIAINSTIGTIQEGRAINSLEKLRSLTRHKALVRRDGEELLVSAEEIVPGDILIIKSGDRISADARVIKEESFKVDEATLTGEAYAVDKTSEIISKNDLVVGDQKNMVFAGTSAVAGYCEAVVVATGFASELGKISKEIKETANVPLPLAKKIEAMTRFIGICVFAIAGLVFAVGVLRGIPFSEIFGATVGIVVSLIPEGLPVAVTIVLAHGVFRMAKAKAIVRQMAAVEAMGNADTLLVDKTGTITTGKMVIRRVLFGDRVYEITGEGYEPKGKVSQVSTPIKSGSKVSKDLDELRSVLELAYLSLTADVVHDENGGWKPSGDTTEVAIAVLCRKAGLDREKLEKEYRTVFAKPFDQQKRYIEASFETRLPASLRGRSWPAGKEGSKKHHVFVGAPDFLSKHLKVDHGFLGQYHELAKEGMRVVGVAVFDGTKVKNWALLAIDEEIRPSVRDSIEEAKNAGFGVVMLTGDYPETAREIARKVGIFEEGDGVLTGVDVEKLSETELADKINRVSVFARITPDHKLKIVKAFQKIGRICAMTGDGVNDAPALQAANLGIGLGSGTQVAKDSSDIVLVNNNFETIVDAIFEGRAIYVSLKKVILYLFSTSFGEVLVLVGAVLVGLPLPLVAVQIIWLNFVTDGFFVVALAQDNPSEKKLLETKNGDHGALVDGLMTRRTVLMGLAMMVSSLVALHIYFRGESLGYTRTVVLVILSVSQWLNAFNVRSRSKSVFRVPPSRWLIASFVCVFVLQLLVVETALGNKLLHTQNLRFGDWILAFAASTLVIWVEEGRKLLVKVMSQRVAPFKSGS